MLAGGFWWRSEVEGKALVGQHGEVGELVLAAASRLTIPLRMTLSEIKLSTFITLLPAIGFLLRDEEALPPGD